MPEEHQTSRESTDAGHRDDAQALDPARDAQPPPVLPDPVAFHAYLKRLANSGTRS
jgi:hypothetical protein